MNNKRVILPNLFTVANLGCGYLALVKISEGSFVSAAWLIILAAFLDAFDGKIARMTRSESAFGVEFDSLADLVSCGLAPAFLAYTLFLHTWGTTGALISFLYVLAAAYRLARFRVTAGGALKDQFLGMPVPLAAIGLASYVIFHYDLWGALRFGPGLLPFLMFLAILMVSRFQYDTFPKFTFADSRGNNLKFALLLVMAGIVAFNPGKAMLPLALIVIFHGAVRSIYRTIVETEESVPDVSVSE